MEEGVGIHPPVGGMDVGLPDTGGVLPPDRSFPPEGVTSFFTRPLKKKELGDPSASWDREAPSPSRNWGGGVVGMPPTGRLSCFKILNLFLNSNYQQHIFGFFTPFL